MWFLIAWHVQAGGSLRVATKGGKGMSSRAHPGSERPLHGPLQMFDLGAEVGRLMEEGAWQRGQRNSITA